MPAGARYIIEQLNNAGFEAYIVGGCVRDSLLNKYPNDWDITTSAKPEQVKQIFGRTIDTGIQHGTVTVVVDRMHAGNVDDNSEVPYTFEVTTYRVDGEYRDHRRPEEVTFTASLKEDLQRRDFTINAMAYNDQEGIVDIFGGMEDLDRGIVRCVGNPRDRFDEDALRILRAVRFAAQLGFIIDDPTRKAMADQAHFLSSISAERIQVELTKLITSDNPDMLVDAYELGLTAVILPEFDEMMKTAQNNPYHKYNVGIHTIEVMKHTPKDMTLRYSALLHDVGKPSTRTTDETGVDHFYGHQQKSADMARQILRRLRLDNNTINRACKLILNHDYGLSGIGDKAFRRFLNEIGAENFLDFMLIRTADIAGQSDYRLEERLENLQRMKEMYQDFLDKKQCVTMADLAIDGKALIELGMKPGRELGQILRQLLDMVIENPELNTREQLEAIAINIISST